MKNRKKKTGMIPIVTAVIILIVAMGLFPGEKALAAEHVKAVTTFHAGSQLSEAYNDNDYANYGLKQSAGLPDPAGNAVKLPKIPIPHIELPEIDFSNFDKEAEKEKLREALEEMDRRGLSPRMILQRVWNRIFPGGTGEEDGKTTDATEEPVTEKVKKKVSGEWDRAVDRAADHVKKRASEELGRAVDQAVDQVVGSEKTAR